MPFSSSGFQAIQQLEQKSLPLENSLSIDATSDIWEYLINIIVEI